MPTSVENQILASEEAPRLAMLASDLDTLDALISPDLIFTNHLGQVFSKQDDLALHRSGLLKFQVLEPSEQQIKATDDLAVVLVRMQVSGTYADEPFAADLRYTRIWRLSASQAWQIIAGHISAVPP